MSSILPRCGDTVRHGPTGEEWLVAWAEGNELAWSSCPEGCAHVADCDLVRRATDAEHARLVEEIAGKDGSWGGQVRRLYADLLGLVTTAAG